MELKIRSNSYIALVGVCTVFVTFAVFGIFDYTESLETASLPTLLSVPADIVEEVPKVLPKTTLLVFGDVMLDRYIRRYIIASTTASLFEYVQDDINKADAVLVNLEGPITDYASVVSKDNLQFTFAPHIAYDLANIGIDIVSLANNHTNNFGKKGLQQTRSYLDEAGIMYFGDPANDSTRLVTRYTVGNTNISFVGYHQFENPDMEKIFQTIRREKADGRFVVFFPHWGIEYDKEASNNQKLKAEGVLDAGADIVIGAHPHVIQNANMVKNKPVFYSLGNFIFDQWFTEDVKYGLALLLTFNENSLESLELKPFYRDRYQPKWLHDEIRQTWCREYVANFSFKVDQNGSCILKLE